MTLWKELQKLSVTKIYSVGFNHDTDFDADHDAEILCKRIKQLIGLEHFIALVFSIIAGLGVVLLIFTFSP